MGISVKCLVLVVSHGCDIAIPTRTAIAAFVALTRCNTRDSASSIRAIHCRRIGCDFGSVLKVRRSSRVKHGSRNAHGEIRGKLTEHFAVLANDCVFARGQPVLHIRSEFAHLDDIDEMRERLKITRIVPTEVRNLLALLSDHECHCCHPARIEQRIVTALHCIDHIREVVHSLASIALLASATLYLAESRTDMATLRGNAGTPAWHLGRLRKAADDIFGFGMNETSFGRVNRNRARGSLCESESSHGVDSTIAESRCQAGSFGLWITCG